MGEVYREKCLLGDYIITDKDFNIFFRRKAEQNQRVAGWTDYTFYKLKQVYKRILVETGFVKKNNKNIEITRPLMEQDLIDSVPLIMFYPGTYSGQNIRLCNEIDDQNYYRAFKLAER